ncbi:MAG: T9SS type A sorting domain-containing protein [Bacteroidota bacterium]|nr:T9SS type A sorting domain-containing protein [Bacteroidota bacterium]
MKSTIINRFLTRLPEQGNRVGRKTSMILVLAMLILSGISSNARLSGQTIGFDFQGLIGMPDTVAAGDSYPVGVFVKNFSSFDSLLNDSVQIVGGIDTIPGPGFTSMFALPPVGNISLLPGDTQFFIIPILFDIISAGFHIGNNVIVVWPICTSNPNFNTQDSITVNVVVLSGISTGPEPGEIKCFPVPANGPLFVTSSNRTLVIKQIVITDASGKIIAVSDNPGAGIDTNDWAAGIYLLDITFENGQKSVYKVIR